MSSKIQGLNLASSCDLQTKSVLGVENQGTEHTLQLLRAGLYAGQGVWVPTRETEAQLVGRRLTSAEHPAWSAPTLTAAQ